MYASPPPTPESKKGVGNESAPRTFASKLDQSWLAD